MTRVAAVVAADAMAGVEGRLEPGLGKLRDLGAIVVEPLCRATVRPKAELPRAGWAEGFDLQGSRRISARAGEAGERVERAGAPSADFKILEAEAEAAEAGVDVAAIDAEQVANLAAKLKHGAVSA